MGVATLLIGGLAGHSYAQTADWPPAPVASPTSACSSAVTGTGTVYNVGPGKAYTELTDVPWLSLKAGDVVNIYYRAEPYRTKWLLRANGAASAPVVINGVTSTDCVQPTVSGENAVTARDAVGQIDPTIETDGLIKIHNKTAIPGYIKIQNLHLTGVRRDKYFTAQNGARTTYSSFAAAIYAVAVHDLTIENCEIENNGQGVFTNSRGPGDYSANVILRGNLVYENGYPDDDHSHNLYIQARRVLYEGNYIGQARAGSSLKDRSSGTVIRYNRILASARGLDLVESEGNVTEVLTDPLYHHAWVYGNVIENDERFAANGGPAFTAVHWGFDNNLANSRKGTLFFYNNTYMLNIAESTDGSRKDTNLFELGREGWLASGTRVEAFSNVIWKQGTAGLNILWMNGTVKFRGTNLMPTSWSNTRDGDSGAVVDTTGAVMTKVANPMLSSVNYVPQAGSPALDKGTLAPSFTPSGANATNLRVTHQNANYWGTRLRATTTAADLGARER